MDGWIQEMVGGIAGGAFLGVSAVTMSTSAAIDVAIDRTGHDHGTWVYRHANTVPKAAKWIGAGLVVAGLGAKLLPATQGASKPLMQAGAGTIGAWFATNWGSRLLMAAQFDARNGGMHWTVSDIAKNSLDRTHMMGRSPGRMERAFEDTISRLQGHGPLDERIARGDFVPVWQPGDPPPGFNNS